MKGKLLSYEEIVKLPHGTIVWEHSDYYIGKCIINQDREFISSDNRVIDSVGWYFKQLVDGVFTKTNNINIYEWLEEPETEQTITKTEKEDNTYNKTYKGSEILAMIEDGTIDYDVVFTADNIPLKKENLYPIAFITNNLFIIKQKPVDFMTAVNSGKFIRPVSLNKQKNFESYRYWFDFIVTYKNWSNDPLDLINDLWEIEY